MLHQPEVTLRGCVREAVPVTESFGKHARRCYLKKNNGSKLKIIPLGGLEQIGMNIKYKGTFGKIMANANKIPNTAPEAPIVTK